MKYQNLSKLVVVFIIASRLSELNELTRYKIANIFRIDPNYLSKKFKKDTGRNLLEFINFEKMKRAEKKLRAHRDLTVTEISEMVGFAKYNQFRKTFKKIYGLNPWIYRKIRNNPHVIADMKLKHLFEVVAIYIMTRDLSQLSRLTRDGVAKIFELNKNYLGTVFKKGVNMTIHNFIEFERLKRAEVMLITRNDLLIKQIAQMIGIPDCKRFRKKFKAIYGVCPYQYRLLYKS